MNISRDNYESWFLDYLEGRLSESQTDVLLSFLEFNPDLEKELEGLETVRLIADDTRYDLKFTLKKPDKIPDRQGILDHFEEYCLLSTEHQLDSREEEILQAILRNDPSRRRTYNLYRSTLLIPPQEIRYPGKSRLRKSILLIPRVRVVVSVAAASLLVFLGLSILVWNPPVHISEDTTPTAIPEAETNGVTVPIMQEKASPGPTGKRIADKAGRPETGIAKKSIPSGSEEALPVRETLIVKGIDPMAFTPLECPVKPGGSLPGYDHLIQQAHIKDAPQQLELMSALWALADAGIQRINERSEEVFFLEREPGRNGPTRRLTFETQWFGISAPLRSADGRRD